MIKTIEIFDHRNEQKKTLEFLNKNTLDIKSGEFWWYYEGVNIWNEISKDGKFQRVCLVLQTNLDNGLILVCPITTKHYNEHRKHYTTINNYDAYWLKSPSLIINQTRLIDKKRFSHKLSSKKIDHNFVEKILRLYTQLITKKPLQ